MTIITFVYNINLYKYTTYTNDQPEESLIYHDFCFLSMKHNFGECGLNVILLDIKQIFGLITTYEQKLIHRFILIH